MNLYTFPMNKLVLLLLVALLVGCATGKPMRMWNASTNLISPNTVVTFMDRDSGNFSSVEGDDVIRMLDIKTRIEAVAGPMHTNLLLAEGSQPNGFSYVTKYGPRIGITFGMIHMLGKDDDAMAALIGHELAHLYLRHGRQHMDREKNRVTTSVAMVFALGMFGIPMPVEATDVATSAVTNSYSRDDEREADQVSVEYMIKAGFNPIGAVHLQAKLGQVAKSTSLAFMSTHPTSAERVENMKRLTKEYLQKKAAQQNTTSEAYTQ